MLTTSLISLSLLVASSTVGAAPLGDRSTSLEKRIDWEAQIMDFGAAVRNPIKKLMGEGAQLLQAESEEVFNDGVRAPLQSIGSVWKNRAKIAADDAGLVKLQGLRTHALEATNMDHTDAQIRVLKGLATYGGDDIAKGVLNGLSPAVRAEGGYLTDAERKGLGVGVAAVAGTGAVAGGSAAIVKHVKDNKVSESESVDPTATDADAATAAEKRSLADLD